METAGVMPCSVELIQGSVIAVWAIVVAVLSIPIAAEVISPPRIKRPRSRLRPRASDDFTAASAHSGPGKI